MAKGFGAEFDEFTVNFIDGAEDTMRGTMIELTSAVVLSSPVLEGRFRGNWFVTGAKPSTKLDLNKTDKTGTKTISAATSKILSIKDWSIFTITNNLPYGIVIEYGGYPDPVMLGTYNKQTKSYEVRSIGGYSKQAPQGVMRMNVKRFNMILDAQAKQHLPK